MYSLQEDLRNRGSLTYRSLKKPCLDVLICALKVTICILYRLMKYRCVCVWRNCPSDELQFSLFVYSLSIIIHWLFIINWSYQDWWKKYMSVYFNIVYHQPYVNSNSTMHSILRPFLTLRLVKLDCRCHANQMHEFGVEILHAKMAEVFS